MKYIGKGKRWIILVAVFITIAINHICVHATELTKQSLASGQTTEASSTASTEKKTTSVSTSASSEKTTSVSTSTSSEKTVDETTESTIVPTDLDMGDYTSSMTVGDKQLITVTALPTGATSTGMTYASSDNSVATVNSMGRITAIAVGNVKITASLGTLSKSIDITVSAKKSDEVAATRIDIGNYDKTLMVGKTLTLSATAVPSNATNTILTYTSSNNDIATVASTGEVKGITAGSAVITVSANGISAQANIDVHVATSDIKLNSNYVVLKPKGTYTLQASAVPAEAPQSITISAKNQDIVKVSKNVIQAVKEGEATLIVSNGDFQKAVTVIVNKDDTQTETKETETSAEKQGSQNLETNAVLEQIKKSKSIVLQQSEIPILTKEILHSLYKDKKSLTIEAKAYTIKIHGTDIRNDGNEVTTDFKIIESKNSYKLDIASRQNLPGKITIQLKGKPGNMKYLYLYDKDKKKYEYLNQKKGRNLSIDTSGRYMITNHKISHIKINVIALIAGIIIILFGFIGYSCYKRKYWFW